MSIEVRNLTHIYSQGTVFERIALDNVSFDVGPRDFIGIIGHTGSGKSTLVQHINRLLVPTSGTVIVNHIDINDKKVPMKEIVRRVGIVFQYPESQLFEETVYKDVSFGPKNLGYDDEKTDFLVRQSLEIMGLNFEEIKDKSPFELSGGQKRRVAIAGVIAMKPPIMILDEPTSGLDPVGREEMLNMIRDMNQELGICILLVTHSMDDVAQYADKIMVFSEGKLVKYGPPSEVFADSQFLANIRLDVPQSKSVLERLKEKGFDIDTSSYTTKDAAREILRVFGK
ncbi:MAG: energy-coupling factor transporter ATPase [Eubacteriaceae bacterium]|nr:energy-coupling factor transporter ATPase [Eubacteriaceae bacterium]MBR5995508.1 energy-coupling factor transporter ATPase [Eubacteriaceae bacterium]